MTTVSYLENKKEAYLNTSSGDLLLAEVSEQNGTVVMILGDRRIDLDPVSAFELVDILTIVISEMLDGEYECE